MVKKEAPNEDKPVTQARLTVTIGIMFLIACILLGLLASMLSGTVIVVAIFLIFYR